MDRFLFARRSKLLFATTRTTIRNKCTKKVSNIKECGDFCYGCSDFHKLVQRKVQEEREREKEKERELKINIDFKSVGIGGLDGKLYDIIKYVLCSYILPKDVIKKYEIKRIKGILLHGPPGTGKSLIARKLVQIIPDVKIEYINGPELDRSLVGETEKLIRELFTNQDGKIKVIIFDEIDSIASKRGISNNHHSDKVLTQLLTMIDGISSSNDTLVIGLTNRKDSLDPAILRSGRLEYHVQIDLPDEFGRKDILEIYLQPLIKSFIASEDINLDYWARKLEGFSGSDIQSLVSKSKNLALMRNFDIMDHYLSFKHTDNYAKITNDDIELSYSSFTKE